MSSNFRTFLVYGVSKGLGKAIVEHIPERDDRVYGISRSQPMTQRSIQWVAADLGQPQQASQYIKQALGDQQIDVLIYNVGVWEQHAFTEQYDFADVSADEIQCIINTNISACILSIQSLLDNLKLSNNAKVILIGSTWGLDHHNGQELVFSASKFALRGIAHALREILRKHCIAVTVLNLGYLATEDEGNTASEESKTGAEEGNAGADESKAGADEANAMSDKNNTIVDKSNTAVLGSQQSSGLNQNQYIPVHDVIQAIRFVISTSPATCVKEIMMPAMADLNI